MNGLDLFSGIGGITQALEGYASPIAYCENNPYCQRVLLSRMADGQITPAPIWDDVRTLKADFLPSNINIIYGGFPCQDVSIAGRRNGLEGKRTGLFFEIVRLTCEIRPRFVFMENVTGITLQGLERIVAEFAACGYDCRTLPICASEVGSPMHGHRWFFLSAANSLNGKTGMGIFKDRPTKILESHARQCASLWLQASPEPTRVANGIPYSMDAVTALGNSVVPAQAREAFERLMGLK